MKKSLIIPVFLNLLFLISTSLYSQVRMPSVFSDHMVLQQNSNITIWGWADINEKVSVKASWDNLTLNGICSHTDGRWKVSLRTPAAGGPYTVQVKGNNNTLLFSDVMVGEVWICSGQSNMEMKLPQAIGGKEEIAGGKYPDVRFFKVPKTASASPQDNCFGSWINCTSQSMPDFSAVGYFYAKKLSETLNVPVGMINTNWGGSPIEAWIPAEKIESDSFLLRRALQNDNRWSPILPGSLWNAMIHPVDFFPVAGAIWYQGEANVMQYETYSQLMKIMIDAWREEWKTDFPFYFVQIAPYTYRNNHSAFLREQQTISQQISNTGMVVISDLVPDTNDIHPTAKAEVGIRLANWALAKHYGKAGLIVSSPDFDRQEITPKGIRIYFKNCPNGLMVKGKGITGFEIAGKDGKYIPAFAKLEKGNTVLVSAPGMKEPVKVRYCFQDAFVPSLFSSEGLPLNSFRTVNE